MVMVALQSVDSKRRSSIASILSPEKDMLGDFQVKFVTAGAVESEKRRERLLLTLQLQFRLSNRCEGKRM
jgi:hypothetical protein